jgi:hypothetical protein
MAVTQPAQTIGPERPKRSLTASNDQLARAKTEFALAGATPLTTTPRQGRTEVPQAEGQNTPLASYGPKPAEVGVEEPTLLSSGVKAVDAVVAEINETSVILNCFSPVGSVLVSFPRSVVPSKLLQYGQPVRLSIDRTSGYRVPRIQERSRNNVGSLEGEEEIRAWIKSL